MIYTASALYALYVLYAVYALYDSHFYFYHKSNTSPIETNRRKPIAS